MIYFGIVENRMDPLELGRCQVRIVNVHTHDKNLLPTADLPWAHPMGTTDSASMNGIGRTPVGLVEGTTVLVVFADEAKQQPIMIGTLGGIPQGDNAVDNTEPELMVSSSLDTPIEIPLTTSDGSVVTSSDGTPVGTGVTQTPAPAAPSQTAIVPGVPPFGPRSGSSVKIPSTGATGIVTIGAAMDQLNITSTFARAAILGIIGGESDWVPQTEGYRYSRSRLTQVFSWMGSDDADKYANWTGDPADFFSFVYGPTTRSGKNLGNTSATDGGRYFGRGYIQLTGAYNYKRYGQLAGVDIYNNPDLLLDPATSALVSVVYFVDRVKVAQNDPGYFEAACAAVGTNVPNIKQKKSDYYHYFLINDASAKLDAPPPKLDATPGAQPANIPIAKNGLPADRQFSVNTGFRDPNMKYPLREFLHEPDTNRMARGVTHGTSVQMRDNQRVQGIPSADGTTFDQPPVPYNAFYPYNSVYQSESGHVQEFDDTPGNERINTMHRSGTFTEVDTNGSQVNRIVGDGYEIIDNNGYVYVRGAYTLTVEGTTNILISADANITVEGQADLKLRGGANVDVSGDYNVSVTGDMKTTVYGDNKLVVMGENNRQIFGSDQVIALDSYVTTTAGHYVLSSGPVMLQGVPTRINNGSIPAEFFIIPGLPTLPGVPTNNMFPNLQVPPRYFEDETVFETPEEIASPAGLEFHKQRDDQIIGEKTDPNTPSEDSAKVAPNNLTSGEPSCDLIYNMSDFPLGMKLSDNFTLSNFIADPKHVLMDLDLKDGTVSRRYTKQEIVCNLKGLAESEYEKLIELIPGGRKGFIITSGFRNQPGSASDHPKGNAMDIVLAGANYDYQAHYDLAQKLADALPYHQLILEYRDSTKVGGKRIVWLHISHRYQGAAKSAFTMLNDKTYGQGFHLLA